MDGLVCAKAADEKFFLHFGLACSVVYIVIILLCSTHVVVMK